jgi:hypothetical protein
MDARRKRRGFALTIGGLGAIMLIAGMVSAASAQISPSSTTSIPASTAPATTDPATTGTQPSETPPIEIGSLCILIFQTPAAPDAPVVAQVLVRSTGEVIATRTGTGPYVPADFASRCETTTTSVSPSSTTTPAQPSVKASAARPVAAAPTFTG